MKKERETKIGGSEQAGMCEIRSASVCVCVHLFAHTQSLRVTERKLKGKADKAHKSSL